MLQGLTPFHALILSAKQGGIWYNFYNLWYDLTGDPTSQYQAGHSPHKATGLVREIEIGHKLEVL